MAHDTLHAIMLQLSFLIAMIHFIYLLCEYSHNLLFRQCMPPFTKSRIVWWTHSCCLFARYERKLRDARENSSMWSFAFWSNDSYRELCEIMRKCRSLTRRIWNGWCRFHFLKIVNILPLKPASEQCESKRLQRQTASGLLCEGMQSFSYYFLSSSPTLFFPPYIFSQCKTTANNISEWRGASHTNGAREREFMTFTERITEHHRTREMKTLMEFIAFCSWSGKWCLWCCKKNAQLFNHPNSIMSRVNSPFFFLILHIFHFNFIISFAFFQKRAEVEHLYDIDSRRRRVPGQRYSIKFTIVTRITRNGIVSTTRHALKCG